MVIKHFSNDTISTEMDYTSHLIIMNFDAKVFTIMDRPLIRLDIWR